MTIKSNAIPSRLPWEVIFFKTPLEPWGRYVIRGPDAPGGIAVTIGGLGDGEYANACYIARACNLHTALVDQLRDAVNAMERMDVLLLNVTGATHEAEKGEIARARAVLAQATTPVPVTADQEANSHG